MWSRISFPNDAPTVAIVAAAIVAAACARDNPPAARDTTSAASLARQTAEASADTTCPMAGEWRPCSVLDRLEHAGLVVARQAEPVRIPLFSVPGITYTTSQSTIHVFLYADQAARLRDTEQLDSSTVAPRGGSHAWSDPVVLVTSNNLAAVVVSPNERQAERIVLALSAGLPAARPTRP